MLSEEVTGRYLAILSEELVLATGCTEPIAHCLLRRENAGAPWRISHLRAGFGKRKHP
jgi:L-cysteine desulfidase